MPARWPHRYGQLDAAGLVGLLFKTIGKHVPPPPLVPSPLLWGTEAAVRERMADGVTELQLTRRKPILAADAA